MVRQTMEQAVRMGAPRARALCQCFGGALDFQHGRFDAAEARLRDAVETYQKVGGASGEALSLQRLGLVLTVRGRSEEAMDAFQRGLFVAERAIMRSHCLTRLQASMARNRLHAGDVEAAKGFIADGLATAAKHGNCVTCNALLLPEAVRLRLATRETRLAEAHARELGEIAERFQSKTWTAMALHARGRVLAARRRYRDAEHALGKAADAFRSARDSYEAARCDRARAAALRKLGAAATLREAAEAERRAEEARRMLGVEALED